MMTYSLRKAKHILRRTYHLFQKQKQKLPHETRVILQQNLCALQQEVLNKNREQVDRLTKQVLSLQQAHLRVSRFSHFKELVGALAFALILAILIRQMWFEFYEIPSGSMRPTLKEQDRLAVSKTTFGINIPLTTSECYFDTDLVQRNGIVIFTGQNMDIHDVDTTYFYLFPGKKQYVKRLIGKPGDVLYFYGGQIWGIDATGKDITPLLQLPSLSEIDHIPFIDFVRKTQIPPTPSEQGIYSPLYIYQMNEPIAKLSAMPTGQVRGEIVVSQRLRAQGAPAVKDYGDLWGINHYGMARIFTRNQVEQLTDQNLASMPVGCLYLEIRHHPTILHAKCVRDDMGRIYPSMGVSTSILPLQEENLKEIFDHMYTARFVVKSGRVFRYGLESSSIQQQPFLPSLPGVPNGTYEFYNGYAYSIGWGGISKQLPDSHPLYQFSPEMVQVLFNLGIEWDTRFSPQFKNQRLVPSRYTYFREGALYLLGTSILLPDDAALQSFVNRERERAKAAPVYAPYAPFVDAGPPWKNGGLDIELIHQYGLRIPEGGYLVLGDNHAMSADSREFGFVPQQNLRGAPSFIFWPPGPRWGSPNQPQYPFMNIPCLIVWLLAAIAITGGAIHWKKRNALPLKFDQ